MPIDEGERRWIATGSFGVLAPMQGIRPVRALRLRADFVRPEWRLNPRTRLGVGGSLGFSYGSRTEHPTLYFGFVTDPDTVEMQRAITVDAMPMGRLFFEVNERIELFAQSGAGLQWGHYSLERTTDLIDYRIESRASANHTALALRFGGGASFKASASWRLAVELVGLDFLVGSTGVGSLYSLLVGAQYAL